MNYLSNIGFEQKTLAYKLASIRDLNEAVDFEIETRNVEKVLTVADYDFATTSRDQFYEFKKQVESCRKSAVAPLNEQKQQIQDAFNPLLDKLSGAIDNLNRKIAEYQKEQNRLRREAEAKRQAEEEARRKEQQERITAAKSAEEVNAILKQDSVEAELELTPAMPAQAKIDKSVSVVKNFKVTVTDPAALMQFVIAHPEFASWVSFKEKEIEKYLKVTEGKAMIPGTSVSVEETYRTRRAKTKAA